MRGSTCRCGRMSRSWPRRSSCRAPRARGDGDRGCRSSRCTYPDGGGPPRGPRGPGCPPRRTTHAWLLSPVSLSGPPLRLPRPDEQLVQTLEVVVRIELDRDAPATPPAHDLDLGPERRPQVGALQVLHEGELEPVAAIAANHRGDRRPPGEPGGEHAAVAGDELVPVAVLRHHNWLQDAMRPNGCGELGEALRVEGRARLLPVRTYELERELGRSRKRRRLFARSWLPEQDVEPAPKSGPRHQAIAPPTTSGSVFCSLARSSRARSS